MDFITPFAVSKTILSLIKMCYMLNENIFKNIKQKNWYTYVTVCALILSSVACQTHQGFSIYTMNKIA